MTDSAAAAEATPLPIEYLTDVELAYMATKCGLTAPDGGRLPRAGEMTAEGVLDLGVKLNNAVAGKVALTLAPPSVVEAATNLREAQKAYMADRGSNELGARVGKCSAYLDRALKAHAAALGSVIVPDLRRTLEERAALCREHARTAAANNYRYTGEAEAELSLAEAAAIDGLLAMAVSS